MLLAPVLLAHLAVTPGDLDIEIMVASNQELYAFIDDLRFRFPAIVGEYEAAVFLETLKVRCLPF